MERIALTFSSRDNNDADLIVIARVADDLGYESFWTGDPGDGRPSRIPVPAGMTANIKPSDWKR